MKLIPNRNQIKKGKNVSIETKENQGTGKLTNGTVENILTSSESHPHGIKVKLSDGQVGRVKSIENKPDTTNIQSFQFEDLENKDIPKTEDSNNEFKEFYQYDPNMASLFAEYNKNKGAINGMAKSAQERIATVVCSFGNSHTGGFLYIGIKDDGTISGLDRDMKFGAFKDYSDKFANHILDKLINLIDDNVFINSRLQIKFCNIQDKTICIIQVLPSNEPLYLSSDEKAFFTRSPVPRAVKLEGKDLFKYIKERFPDY